MKPAFSVKSAHLDALSIQLQDSNIEQIRDTLQEQIDKHLKFKALPFILDVRQLDDGENVPFTDILALFALHGLKIVGLHAPADWEHYAEKHQLVLIAEKTATPAETEPVAEITQSDDTLPEPSASTETIASDSLKESADNDNTVNAEDSSNDAAVEEAADAFARELFGETDETADKAEADKPTTDAETVDKTAENDDILTNDNDAIKTVEMAKPAELVELSPEEARRLAEEQEHAATELTSEEGEAKGEIVSISEAKQTIVVSTPVRTGQQIYAEKADLIVLGIVSPGAEVIADGNIHIYAPLRGRALAGASGDRKARIFVQSMQAELVSIAGIYRTFEQSLPNHLSKQPVRIELQDDRLAISAIIAE